MATTTVEDNNDNCAEKAERGGGAMNKNLK